MILFTCIIFNAKEYTQNTILTDLKLKKWRIYNQKTREINIIDSNLPNKWKNWLIKIQDPDFYNHNGVDLNTAGAGLTTITQSIVKKLYFKNFKPGYRKIKQSLIAYFVVNKILSKSEQLTIFLNVSYMGNIHGKYIIGFENAAQAYFQKPLLKLNDDQYLSLLAMLINSKKFNIKKYPKNNKQRVKRIKKVLSGEYIPKNLTDLYYY